MAITERFCRVAAELGRRLGRDASVISREIVRHGGIKVSSGVEALAADPRKLPVTRSRIRRPCSPRCVLLATGTTPKQIEVALVRRHHKDASRRRSHETIYDFIYIPSKGLLRKELISYLRRKKLRRSPAPGILVIPERFSRYVMIVPMGEAKDAKSVECALTRAFKLLPVHLRKTLTYDNGREMARHAVFPLATKIPAYFCDPHSPWQRGSVENINGLIREYFPKGIDFNTVTKGQISKAEWRDQQPPAHRPR